MMHHFAELPRAHLWDETRDLGTITHLRERFLFLPSFYGMVTQNIVVADLTVTQSQHVVLRPNHAVAPKFQNQANNQAL
ncbi:MAG: hypothetical protein M1294_10785 [Firmicutes bacterium]|uniref:Uncharacterized protein n=1 Tax=Sulfobacillus benefaciens TaxID=453960 RepID=A0A2T2WPR1_9FIRM|nr:hypothetical protein [Bacillota bacterium]MCL5014687.1 hypothetical protein [Bacillota bacterium]PSR24227.1 MAG: hypothetical protein C7B43_19515 [Sulfobacillus benefaciens]